MNNILIVLVTTTFIFGCVTSALEFELDEDTYRLTNADGQCRVLQIASSTTVDLSIPFPCAVHTNTDGTVRSVENNSGQYIVIESSTPDLEFPGDCVTHLQAILITTDKMAASEYSDKVATCPPFQWDEQVFVGLFED